MYGPKATATIPIGHQLVTVSIPSSDPTGISINMDDACVGVSKVLTVEGGTLGMEPTGSGTVMQL